MVEDYIKEKVQDLINYTNGVSAVEAGLELAIHNAVKNRTNPEPGALPDYGAISGNEALKTDISNAIDSAYSLDNELHPMHDSVNQANLARNFYNQKLFEEMLFPHKNAVKNKIGEDNLMDILRGARGQSQQVLKQKLIGAAAGETTAQHNLDQLKEYLTNSYGNIGAELEAVNEKERLTRAIGMDYMRLLGANVGIDQIREAIRNPNGQ